MLTESIVSASVNIDPTSELQSSLRVELEMVRDRVDLCLLNLLSGTGWIYVH